MSIKTNPATNYYGFNSARRLRHRPTRFRVGQQFLAWFAQTMRVHSRAKKTHHPVVALRATHEVQFGGRSGSVSRRLSCCLCHASVAMAGTSGVPAQ